MNKVALSIGLLLVAVLTTWYLQGPASYQFVVNNLSGEVIDRVSLMDSAVAQVVSKEMLQPGETVRLEVELLKEGVLRFQVERGLNRLDGILAKDVSQLNSYQKQLDIHPNNRLVLSDINH